MRTIKGPGIFLAQFIGDDAPFDSLDGIADWAAGLGYKGLQIPTSDPRFLDLATAADSQDYCDEIMGRLAAKGLSITDPLAFESQINQWPGVVTVGVFAHQKATVCLLGTAQGVKTLDYSR